MKTRTVAACVLLCISVEWMSNGETSNSPANATAFPTLSGKGYKLYAYRPQTNTFPIICFFGENHNYEVQVYLARTTSKKEFISEIQPAEIDTNGNWGAMKEEMQVSVRFKEKQFAQGEMVPAYMILRNLSNTNRAWERNGYPDCGYIFTLRHGTNMWVWMRPKQTPKPMNIGDTISGHSGDDPPIYRRGDDPLWFKIQPQTQDLTILYLNRFFDLTKPGKYEFHAEIAVPKLDGSGETNCVSGVATFEVVQKPK